MYRVNMSRMLQRFVDQLESGAIRVPLAAIERAGRGVVTSDLQRDVGAAGDPERRFARNQQALAHAVTAILRRDEQFVDLRRQSLVFEAEHEDGEQVARGLSVDERDPGTPQRRIRD